MACKWLHLCSEPLQWLDTAAAFAQFRQALQAAGLQLVEGGRFWHLMGNHDKASAMQRLCEKYRAAGFQDFRTVALGDSPNDIPMLVAAGTGVAYRAKDIVLKATPHHLTHAPLDVLNEWLNWS